MSILQAWKTSCASTERRNGKTPVHRNDSARRSCKYSHAPRFTCSFHLIGNGTIGTARQRHSEGSREDSRRLETARTSVSQRQTSRQAHHRRQLPVRAG